jgi:hypothetical protein
MKLCIAAITAQKITDLTVNLQDSLIYGDKPLNFSGRPEDPEDRGEPVDPYPHR